MMKWLTQLKKDKQTLARLDRKQKATFIWDYYKLPILSVVVVAALVTVSAVMAARSADVAFYAVLINANNSVETDSFAPLLEEAGVDMTGKRVDIEANYTLSYDDSDAGDAQTLQVLAALFGIGDLDVFVADEPVFESYAAQDAFVDLSLFVEEEVLQAWSGDLYYTENADGEQILSGIWLREDSFLHRDGYYGQDVLLGVAANAQNLDNAIAMVQQLLKK